MIGKNAPDLVKMDPILVCGYEGTDLGYLLCSYHEMISLMTFIWSVQCCKECCNFFFKLCQWYLSSFFFFLIIVILLAFGLLFFYFVLFLNKVFNYHYKNKKETKKAAMLHNYWTSIHPWLASIRGLYHARFGGAWMCVICLI